MKSQCASKNLLSKSNQLLVELLVEGQKLRGTADGKLKLKWNDPPGAFWAFSLRICEQRYCQIFNECYIQTEILT